MNRQKILIVDDDPVVVKAMSMKLDSAGFEVMSALDGSDAIAAARKEKPDLILLDVNFPLDVGIVWDGFKLIAWLQRVDETKGTPVVVISGGEAAKFEKRAIEAGAVAYIQKPVDNGKLLVLIRKTLSEAAAKPA